jgi:hypothetical protein
MITMAPEDYVAKLNADIEKHLENLYQARYDSTVDVP